MNLRISLVLIILVSWFSVFGVLIFKSDIGSEKSEEQINYFIGFHLVILQIFQSETKIEH